MRYIVLFFWALTLSSSAFSDNQGEPNYSKFQSNYYLTCPQPATCAAAFKKMLEAPEIASKQYEVTLYQLEHNGWDESTHQVSFYFKNAERYLEASETFAASPAFAEFSEAVASVGVQRQSRTLTTHTITEGDSRATNSNLTWTIKVTDPATFVPAWKKFTAAMEKHSWAPKGYGLQTVLLGNQGWATHEIWASFSSAVEALDFLENFTTTSEWQDYALETSDAVTLVRSFMANAMVALNED